MAGLLAVDFSGKDRQEPVNLSRWKVRLEVLLRRNPTPAVKRFLATLAFYRLPEILAGVLLIS